MSDLDDPDTPNDRIYRAGLLDALNDRPTLAYVLLAAEENELLIHYARGRVMGARLLSDAELAEEI